ncbi:serine/threonine-protein kinase pim-2 [Danio aesculapii]|uniref:serine/threonine-protein kinase pim-2 n=1 Tax=Danio aesculapii TaxID=1142201 RepID=UPI0024BF8906|nr:serine/threonine-protein kinase pim-2 [Danio aesculapii]
MRPPVQVCDRLESLAVPGTSRIKPTTIADHVDSEQMRPPVQVCEDSQPLSVPGLYRMKQTADPARPESSTALTGHVDTELVCLPGQIWEDPRLISVHGPSNIKKMTDADSACPESPLSVQDPSKIDGTDEKPKKGRKGKRVSAFFKRVWKAAKLSFLCCDTDIVQHLMPLPEPEPEPKPESGPESQPEPNPEPEPEEEAEPEAVPVKVTPGIAEPADPESVCLPGQVPEEPKEAYGLTLGSVVSHFEVMDMIGEGAFGQVYVASHVLSEKEKVALKYIIKRRQDRYLDIDGHSKPVLAEVAIMLRLMNAPQCPNIIRLHDWIENESDSILILEYPESCQTLDRYITNALDISENQARRLVHQLIQAVKFCAERGVFHGDIHTRNILVTTPQLELKLIDFGCAWPLTRGPFYSWKYQGAICYTPPEILRHRKFFPSMANVWAIGIVLYEILHGRLPFYDRQSIMVGDLHTDPTLSSACQDLISQCLIRNPVRRIQLHQVEEHQWFNTTSPNAVQQ